MERVKIKLTKENHKFFKMNLLIKTIFGDFLVSRYEMLDPNTIAVDEKYFDKYGLNPCHIVNGYLGRM